MPEGGRSKRRCASRQAQRNRSGAAPSAVHYVGYVEDEETPEMIMRKFEEMERIMGATKTVQASAPTQEAEEDKENKPKNGGVAEEEDEAGKGGAEVAVEAAAQGLSEEQLMEIFKQTSMFNVKSALANNECLMGADDMFARQGVPGMEDEWADSDFEEFRGFWSDDEEWDEVARPARKRGPKREKGEPRTRGGAGGNAYSKPKSHVVSTYNSDTQSFIRRNVKVEDRLAIELIKVPAAPLPLSWGRSVKPFHPAGHKPSVGANETERGVRSSYYEYPFLDANVLRPLGSDFQAVFINSGWEKVAEPMTRFAQLPVPRLCPSGFIFMWVPKTLVHPVVRQMFRWGYAYIENLTWVTLDPNHSFLELEAHYLRRSHLTLYMFRKIGEGKDIELKHQRNPDVVFDCITHAPGRAFKTPDEIWVAIETLLPSGKGKFLELWGEKGVQREGWVHAVEEDVPRENALDPQSVSE